MVGKERRGGRNGGKEEMEKVGELKEEEKRQMNTFSKRRYENTFRASTFQ